MKKNEMLFDIINDLPDDLIEKAAPDNKVRETSSVSPLMYILPLSAVAASVVLFAAAGRFSKPLNEGNNTVYYETENTSYPSVSTNMTERDSAASVTSLSELSTPSVSRIPASEAGISDTSVPNITSSVSEKTSVCETYVTEPAVQATSVCEPYVTEPAVHVTSPRVSDISDQNTQKPVVTETTYVTESKDDVEITIAVNFPETAWPVTTVIENTGLESVGSNTSVPGNTAQKDSEYLEPDDVKYENTSYLRADSNQSFIRFSSVEEDQIEESLGIREFSPNYGTICRLETYSVKDVSESFALILRIEGNYYLYIRHYYTASLLKDIVSDMKIDKGSINSAHYNKNYINYPGIILNDEDAEQIIQMIFKNEDAEIRKIKSPGKLVSVLYYRFGYSSREFEILIYRKGVIEIECEGCFKLAFKIDNADEIFSVLDKYV